MTYSKALAYLSSFTNFEKQTHSYRQGLGLGRIIRLLDLLGNPHKRFKSILIAGTNGKGSTAALIHSVLHASGYAVGLYTSPHLIDIRERIKCGTHMISRHTFRSEIEIVREVVKRKWKKAYGMPTYFEILTAVAFQWFARKGVDCAVIEVGLGGRLDATNVVDPLFSIITSIGYDHQHILGNTLRKIATEKAGIIKRGSWVISGAQPQEVMAVLQRISFKRRSELLAYKKEFSLSRVHHTSRGIIFSYKGARIGPVPLWGEFQIENCAVALKAVELAGDVYGFRIPRNAVQQGFSSVVWPGRFEIVQKHPLVIADGAHNSPAAHALVASLKKWYPQHRVIFIVGFSHDKQYDDVIEILSAYSDQMIVTTSHHPRSCPVSVLYESAKKRVAQCFKARSLNAALIRGTNMAQHEKNTALVVCGSLFLVGALKRVNIERSRTLKNKYV